MFIFVLVVGSAGLFANAFQERVYIDTASYDAERRVAVFIDSEMPINAFLIEVAYDQERAIFVSSNDSGSMADIWQTLPPKDEGGLITLAGGMTESFVGTNAKLIELTFLAFDDGSADIRLQRAVLYSADGKGTEIIPSLETTGSFYEQGADDTDDTDVLPPQFFATGVVKNPADGVFLIPFQVRDDAAGIREVTVRFRRFLRWEDPVSASNPITVPPGVWSAKLAALDNAGNSAIQLYILWQVVFKKVIFIVGIVVLFGIVGRFVFTHFFRYHVARK
ncbi:MAG: hypothetical protein HY445_01695 [Candidatus Niyogibacteria bacterium]|nr:hypothetical protein [Candidatus Niyogibacteria bacterium]